MHETGPRRFLVLVIGTLAGPGPATHLFRLAQREPSTFHFVIPATVPDYGWTWTEGQPLDDARERLRIMMEFGKAMGMTVRGEVRNSDDPVEIVRQVVREASEPFEELIVIDGARGMRLWLGARALAELKRDPGLPITRFEADPPIRQGKHFDVDALRTLFQNFLREVVSSR
jgi:hypothetical protein